MISFWLSVFVYEKVVLKVSLVIIFLGLLEIIGFGSYLLFFLRNLEDPDYM